MNVSGVGGAGASSRSGKAGGGIGWLKLAGAKNTLGKGGGGGKSSGATWRENAGKFKGLPWASEGGGGNVEAPKEEIDTRTPFDTGGTRGRYTYKVYSSFFCARKVQLVLSLRAKRGNLERLRTL